MKTTALLVALCLSSAAAMAPLSTKPAYMNGQVNGVTPSVATLASRLARIGLAALVAPDLVDRLRAAGR